MTSWTSKGLIHVHSPTVESGSYGPRSVELTDKARKVASVVAAQRGGSNVGSDLVSEARINELEHDVLHTNLRLEISPGRSTGSTNLR